MRGIDPRATAQGIGVIGQTVADEHGRMTGSDDREHVMWLREQAGAVAQHYPELFAYLRARDQLIHRTLLWIPRPGDPEGYIGFDRLERLLEELRGLPPGIADFVRE